MTHSLASFGLDPRVVELFDEEFLFIEDAAEFWLPVQSVLVPHMSYELSEGDKVTLYVVFIGGRNDGAGPDWIFLVNEFMK